MPTHKPIELSRIKLQTCAHPSVPLTHWGWVMHICVGILIIVGSDNGLSPDQRQAIIWANDGILLIGPLGTHFSEISLANYQLSFKKMPLKMSSEKWRPSCLGLNLLMSVHSAHLTPLLELTSPLPVVIGIFAVNLDTRVCPHVF